MNTDVSAPSLGELVGYLDAQFPPSTAQDWDRVGLVAGDPREPISRVLFAVDPVATVVDEALEREAQLIVVHHPLFLRLTHHVDAGWFKGDVVHRLIRGGCALYAAHTNADVAFGGANDSLAQAIGLRDVEPLTDAAFDEAAQPIGLGRIGRLEASVTLGELAQHIAGVLPPVAQGVRVSGELTSMVETVAVCSGAGDSLLSDPVVRSADVYVTADLRHHPASEAREAVHGDRPFLIDVSHWASEWLWLPEAAARMQQRFGVQCWVSRRVTDPWTAHFASSMPWPDSALSISPSTDN